MHSITKNFVDNFGKLGTIITSITQRTSVPQFCHFLVGWPLWQVKEISALSFVAIPGIVFSFYDWRTTQPNSSTQQTFFITWLQLKHYKMYSLESPASADRGIHFYRAANLTKHVQKVHISVPSCNNNICY